MPSGKKLPKEIIDKILNLYQDGLNCGQISKIILISKQTAIDVLKRNGVEIRKSSPFGKIPKREDIDFFCSQYNEGFSLSQISQKCNFSKSVIRKYIKKNLENLRPSQRQSLIPEEKHHEIIEHYIKTGGSLVKMSERFNFSVSSLHSLLKKNQINIGNNLFRGEEWVNRVIDLYKKLGSYQEVAKELGCNSGAVSHVIKKHASDLISNKFNKRTKENLDKFKEMWVSGEPSIKIKEYFRMKSMDFISTWSRLLNLPPRNYRYSGNRISIIHKDKKVTLRSSWELLFAQYLKNSNKDWDYEFKSYDTELGKYLPDFFVFKDGDITEIHEVKGRITDKNYLKKIELFKTNNPNILFKIWMKHELEEIGVFKNDFKIDIQIYQKSINVKSKIRRSAKTTLYRVNDEDLSIAEISEKYNLSRHIIAARIKSGMKIEDIINKPVKENPKINIRYKGAEYDSFNSFCDYFKISKKGMWNLYKKGFSPSALVESKYLKRIEYPIAKECVVDKISELDVELISFKKTVIDFIRENHYTQTCPSNIKFCFGLIHHKKIIGVACFGSFSRNQSQKKYENFLDFSRMFVLDNTPKNTESFFIGKCLKFLAKYSRYSGVIAYADESVGHRGTIYKASNFKEIGKTNPSYHYVNARGDRVHKKQVWDRAILARVTETDQAIKEFLIKINELPKSIFSYNFNRLQ